MKNSFLFMFLIIVINSLYIICFFMAIISKIAIKLFTFNFSNVIIYI